MINAQELQGAWNQVRGQVKQKWGQLTDEDLTISQGNIDQLVGKIQQKTGEGREAIEKYLNDLMPKASQAVSNLAESARGFAANAGEYASQAGDRLRQGLGQAGDVARERYEMAAQGVRQNPGQSVAAAFGVGLLVGVVLGLATRSSSS